MVRWFVDKTNRVPLYLQLKDLIQYYVSTGALRAPHQLPTVSQMAKTLGITFETVRKAYKELERDGLIETSRGRGSFITGHPSRKVLRLPPADVDQQIESALRITLKELYERVQDAKTFRAIVQQTVDSVATEEPTQFVIFTECNQIQIQSFSGVIEKYLGEPVRGVLIDGLRDLIQQSSQEGKEAASVITTGFHFREVRNLLKDIPVLVDFVVTRMSPQTRRKVEAFDKHSKFGFICRDQSSIVVYKDLLRSELDIPSELACCTLADKKMVESLLKKMDVLLTSPTAYEEIRKIVPAQFPLFNVFDWIDPYSLEAVKERMRSGPSETALRPAASHD